MHNSFFDNAMSSVDEIYDYVLQTLKRMKLILNLHSSLAATDVRYYSLNR